MPRKPPLSCWSGRPNVGKSTLFNRITGSRRAIVAPDRRHDARLAGAAGRRGGARTFELFDTGGLYGASEDPLHELVVQQGQRAIAGADLLVFVVDGREGLVSGDETIARELRETGLPVLLAINKTDDKRAQAGAMEFFQLGFEPVLEISAEHGTGVGDLLDEIVKRLEGRGALGARGRRGRRAAEPADAGPEPRGRQRRNRASPSSAGRTSASRRWSTGCCKRGAGAGQRHAGHDARRDRRRC